MGAQQKYTIPGGGGAVLGVVEHKGFRILIQGSTPGAEMAHSTEPVLFVERLNECIPE